MPDVLARLAASGRILLVAGLAVGIVFPAAGHAMEPTLGPGIALLLVVAAARIGAREAIGAARDVGTSLATVVLLQSLVPVLAFGLLALAGLSGTTLAAAMMIMLAAPPVSGGPSLCILSGLPPAPALRLLVTGTVLLPLTALPVFLLLPELGSVSAVLSAASRLLLTILLAGAAGFALRALARPWWGPRVVGTVDAVAAVTLAVVVVGLMAPVGEALRTDPLALSGWLALGLALNFGLHALGLLVARRLGAGPAAGSFGIVAGNRNIILFLLALPPEQTAPLLLFIGCYQVPMYLTPLLLARIHRREAPPADR